MSELMYYVDLSLIFSVIFAFYAFSKNNNESKILALMLLTINILFTSKEITLENKNRAIFNGNATLKCKVVKEVIYPNKEDGWSVESHYFIKDKWVIEIQDCEFDETNKYELAH